MRIVFLGTADFGIPALQMLHKQHDVVGVVSIPPRLSGRGRLVTDSPISAYCHEHSIEPVFLPESLNDPKLIKSLQDCAADCFVVVAFKLLPSSIFTLPRLGTINIHASLLPAYRGPAPIHRAIEAGEQMTGVTVFRIDEGIDTGAILGQETVPIGEEETTPELSERLSTAGADVLERVLRDFATGGIQPLVQDNVAASKAPKLKKSEGSISWNMSATEIVNKIRAFKPFPGTYTTWKNKKIAIEWAQAVSCQKKDIVPGTVCTVDSSFFDVATGNGLLRIVKVKPEGRKSMQVREFLCGTELQEGSLFS